MKRLITTIMLLCAVPALAGEITLSTPLPGPTTTKITVDGYRYGAASIEVFIAYRDAAGATLSYGSITLQDSCSVDTYISKAECEANGATWRNFFSAVDNFKVDPVAHADKKFSVVLENRIRNQVKQRLGIVGTVVP